MKSEPVHIIMTGGTIGKTYNPLTEKPEICREGIVEGYLKDVIKPHGILTFETVCLKDSLDLTPHDRECIVKAALNSKTNRIVIIHGTSTMNVTAEYLAQEKSILETKCIVLTGAMVPLKEFAMSDAGFNLGYALAQVQTLHIGVYVCMNAKTFSAGHVYKNTTNGRFETV